MTNPRILNRKLHRWGSIAISIPFLIVIVSGLLLQVKKQVPWVQPTEFKTKSTTPTVSMQQLLETAQSVPEAKVTDWSSIDRIDVRPSKGLAKVITKDSWEVQVDLGTGAVQHSAYRRSDLIEKLHDGSFFAEAAKLWVFLPSGLIVLGLWVTGIYLFLLPYQAKANKRRRQAGDA